MNGKMTWNQDVKKGGAKFDQNKQRVDLLPPKALLALANLYGKGANKYADRNWEEGIDQNRLIAAMGRHLFKYMSGEDYDDDPIAGDNHLIHIAWNALSLYELIQANKITDQRTKLYEIKPAVPMR